MDPLVAELFAGPESHDAKGQLRWLLKVHDSFANAPQEGLRQIAPPLKEVFALLSKHQGSPNELEKIQPEVTGLLLEAQGLALLSFVQDFKRVRDVIAEEAAKQKAGSDKRRQGEELQAKYDEALRALVSAYHGFREGKFEELKNAVELLQRLHEQAPQPS